MSTDDLTPIQTSKIDFVGCGGWEGGGVGGRTQTLATCSFPVSGYLHTATVNPQVQWG